MNQYSPFDEIKIDRNVCLKKILNTSDDNEIGYFLELDLGYPYKMEQKKHFPFCPENKLICKDDSDEYMKNIKPKN